MPATDVSRSNERVYTQMISQGHLEDTPNDLLSASDVDTQHSRQVAFEAVS